MIKNYFGIIIATDDYKKFYNQNKEFILQLSLKFKSVYVINVNNLKLATFSKKIKNQSLFPKNFIFKNFSSSFKFLNFFKNKRFVLIQYLSKNPDFFKIFFLIRISKIKNILVMNFGNFGNSQTFKFNKQNIFAFRHFYLKGFYYLFRILTILNIFPKINILFESNKNIIKAIKNGFSNQIENKLPFFKIRYFREIIHVNSIHYDYFVKNNLVKKKNKINNRYILYIDVPFDHPDRILREGKVDSNLNSKYYSSLEKFLKHISKLYNYKIIIGLHPSTKGKDKYFKDFQISKRRTVDLIKNAKMIIVTHSSLIPLSILYKKKIISINSNSLGEFHNNLINKYKLNLNLPSFTLEKNFTNLTKEKINYLHEKSLLYREKYISDNITNGSKEFSSDTIIRIIKKKFLV